MDRKDAASEELNRKVMLIEEELEKHYCQLGKSLLEIAEREQKQIILLVDQLIDTRRRLSKARGEIQCPLCMAMNEHDSRYCRKCGEPLMTKDNREETDYETE